MKTFLYVVFIAWLYATGQLFVMWAESMGELLNLL